jgi:hypothetical protein
MEKFDADGNLEYAKQLSPTREERWQDFRAHVEAAGLIPKEYICRKITRK